MFKTDQQWHCLLLVGIYLLFFFSSLLSMAKHPTSQTLALLAPLLASLARLLANIPLPYVVVYVVVDKGMFSLQLSHRKAIYITHTNASQYIYIYACDPYSRDFTQCLPSTLPACLSHSIQLRDEAAHNVQVLYRVSCLKGGDAPRSFIVCLLYRRAVDPSMHRMQ